MLGRIGYVFEKYIKLFLTIYETWKQFQRTGKSNIKQVTIKTLNSILIWLICSYEMLSKYKHKGKQWGERYTCILNYIKCNNFCIP